MNNIIQTTVTWLYSTATLIWNFMITNSLLKYSIGLFLLARIIYPALRKYIKG